MRKATMNEIPNAMLSDADTAGRIWEAEAEVISEKIEELQKRLDDLRDSLSELRGLQKKSPR